MSLTSEFQPTIGALVALEHRNTTHGLSDEERDEWVRLTRRLFGFDQNERRRFFRLRTRLFARVAWGARSTDAEVLQLSAGGAGLRSPERTGLTVGDPVKISFGSGARSLTDMHTDARVAWVGDDASYLGVEFVETPEDTRASVIEFLGDHLSLLLTRAEDAFKLFFHQSLDLAALLESDGRIITISDTVASSFGSTAKSLIGSNFSTLVAPDDATAFGEACERAQLGGRTRMRIDLIDAEDELIAADIAITPFCIEDLRLGCFLAGHDDRDRKAAEDEIQRLERRLIVTDTMATLGYIAAGIVHDVNNPLTFILMHGEALTEIGGQLSGSGLDSAAAASLVADVVEMGSEVSIGAGRIADLMKELGRFTSLATGDTQVSDLAGVIASVTVMVRNLINHRARLEQSHDPTLGAVALSSGRLTQVLLNLLTNAAQAFSDSDIERNVIRLETRRDADNVVIEVIDNGRGIPSARRAELLKPFATTRAEAGGKGLGLAIAKDCAESVGGTLAIADGKDGGTRITVVLPAHDSGIPGMTLRRAPSIDLDRPPRVLILDDERAILKAYERALRSQFEVVTTSSPTEALALTRQQDYDVIVCDVMIPGISGLDFYDRLREASPVLVDRLIFVTGGTMSGEERGRLQAIGNQVILKPVSAEALAHAVWDMVEARHAQG